MATRRYNPCSFLPRRLQIVSTLTLFIIITILIFGSPSNREQLSESPLNFLRAPAHEPPPEQANSTNGDVSWFSNKKWRHPFSSSVAYDDRAVLPPEARRVPIYTFYEVDSKKNREERQAENDLLLAWRRAWWAKGFRPIILGRPEATNHPLYRQLMSKEFEPALQTDLLRWLAWGNMGTGILSNWLAYPMADYDDPLLSKLRAGDFPDLTTFKRIENGLFAGEKEAINDAIKAALSLKTIPKGNALVDIISKETFRVELHDNAIAFYSTEVIKSKYKSVYDTVVENSAKGMVQLRKLIESHLHSTWQGVFPLGITVLNPIPPSMTAMIEPVSYLAGNLSVCLESPLPSSCPPNIPNCRTCMTSQPMAITPFRVYRNESKTFTLGTVPHPYTMHSLIKKEPITSIKVIRRETERDPYIIAVSKEKLGGRAGFARIVYMKDAVASENGKAHSLWVTAERKFDKAWWDDMSWLFGFPVWTAPVHDGKSETPVPGPERRKQAEKKKEFVPDNMPNEKGVRREFELIEQSKPVLKKKNTNVNKRLRKAVEDWNMADAELWNFVRAFSAQRRMEREKWEEEERSYAGSGSDGSRSWSNWLNKEEE